MSFMFPVFICSLFSDIASNSYYICIKRLDDNELESVWKEEVVVQHMSGGS
jgi:hypothetical protein